MKKAIEQMIGLDLSHDISIAEKSLYDSETKERLLLLLQSDKSLRGEFVIHCKLCRKSISDGIFLRHIKKKQYIVYDANILSRVKLTDTERIKRFDAMKTIAHVKGKECGHSWGVILEYEKMPVCYIIKGQGQFLLQKLKRTYKIQEMA